MSPLGLYMWSQEQLERFPSTQRRASNGLCAHVQLGANDVDTTLAVGALNNIIANNNLTAQFGSINTNALLANSTQTALNETLGPIKLYPLRVAAGVTAECTQAFLTPSTYYALETAYTGTLIIPMSCSLHMVVVSDAHVTALHKQFSLWRHLQKPGSRCDKMEVTRG